MAALMFMHRRGWVHRDVKLDNVMIHADGSVKLADFGYACRYRPGEHLSFQCGSPHYVSPEIASGQAFHGPDADYWAAFVVLHSMAYLTFPFKQTDRKNQMQVLESIKNNARTVLSELRLSWQRQDLAGFINFGLFPNEGRIRRPEQVFADRWVSRMIGECERGPGAWCAHVGAFLLERDRCRGAAERDQCRTTGTEEEDSFERFLDEHRLVANLSRMAVAAEVASSSPAKSPGSATLSSLETYPGTTASSSFPTPSPSLSFEPHCLAPTPTHALPLPANRAMTESGLVSALEAACATCSPAAEPEAVARARVPPLEIERLRLPDSATGPTRRSRARYRAMACLGCVSRSNS
jgi:serine/threonine protein kinase